MSNVYTNSKEVAICKECYVNDHRITPLHNPMDCLQHHTQYICGTCGRCICIERDPHKGLQRWNFPFATLESATSYLRTADITMRSSCGIYEIRNDKGRVSYKIFLDKDQLNIYLKKNKGKSCKGEKPIFQADCYQEYAETQIRKLTNNEISLYLNQRNE